MSKISIKPNADGAPISAYKSNPEFGYIVLESSVSTVDNGWLRKKTRTALVRAEIPLLVEFVQGFGSKIPGHIVVREYLESELPGNLQAQFDKADDYEEAVSSFIKRAGEDGPELTVGGERILRFSDYDATGQIQDISVMHDNQAEIAEFRAATAEAAAAPAVAPAALPAGRGRRATAK